MRRAVVIVGLFALIGGACAGAEPNSSLAPVTFAATSTTEAANGSIVESTTSTSAFVPPSTSYLGPTITYDPAVARYGGTVVVGDDQEPQTLNPYAPGGDNFIVSLIGQAHLARAFDVDPQTRQIIPDALTAIPSVGNGAVVLNDDGTMDVTWTLRPGTRWADGVAMSGDDLEFTLEFQQAGLDCAGREFVSQRPPEVEIIDVAESSLTARFDTPSLEYETLIEWIVPRHEVEVSNYCDEWNTSTWTAGGPFRLVEWDRSEERSITLVRNDNYWKTDAAGNQLPYLDEVRFVFEPETERLARRFTNRELDVINPPPFLGVAFLRVPGALPTEAWRAAGAVVEIVPGSVWEHLNFQFGPNNRNPDSLNGILEFRQAVAYALDRRALLDDAGYEVLTVADGFLGTFNTAATSAPWSRYQPDRDRARQLIAIACERVQRDCATEPPKVIYSTTSNADFRPRVADQVKQQLSEVGIEVELQLEDSQLFFGDTLEQGSWDVGNWAWVGSAGANALVDFFDVFAPGEAPPDGRNNYNWGNPGSSVEGDEAVRQFRELVDRLRGTVDADAVVGLASQLEQILAEQVVIIPLNSRLTVGAVWADEIQGFRMNPTIVGHTWNIEYWYRVGE